MSFLAKAQYPNRVGVHTNTAFALRLAVDYAVTTKSEAFLNRLHKSVQDFYQQDRDMPSVAALEPNNDDFLSPTLMVAALVACGQSPEQFSKWFSAYFPSLPRNLLKPVHVDDKNDSKLVHLDGLNLSRAWCLGQIARRLEDDASQGGGGFSSLTLGGLVRGLSLDTPEDRINAVKEAAEKHLEEGLKNALSGEYSGEHWLGSFAVLALTE